MKLSNEAEKYFKIFFDNAADGMLLADLKTKKIVAGNKIICRLLGCRQNFLKKKPLAGIFPKESLSAILPEFDKLPRKKIILTENIPVKKKNGNIFYADIDASVISLPEGEKYSLSIFRDITDYQKIFFSNDKTLRETAAKDEALLASIADGVVAVDGEGKIILFNRAASNLLGWKKNEAMGKFWFEVIHKQDQNGQNIPYEKSALYLALKAGKISTAVSSYYYVRKNGTKFPVARAVSPVVLAGKTIGAINVFYDISNEKELEVAKNDFLSLASHQLRTPLSSMKWALEMVLDDPDIKERQKQIFQDIYLSNERLIEVVNSVMDAMRIESGKLTVNKRSLSMIELINKAYDKAKIGAEKKGQQVKLFIDVPVDKVVIDPLLFSEALNNLLSNAVGFGSNKSKIIIRISRDEKNYIISIHNSGSFILKSDRDKIFTKFFRGRNSIDSEHIGSGLGLYLVKAAVEANGGKIWFKTDIKKGTTFYFTVPVTEN